MANFEECIDAARKELKEYNDSELNSYLTRVFNDARSYDMLSPGVAIAKAMKENENQEIKKLFHEMQTTANDATKVQTKIDQIKSKAVTVMTMVAARFHGKGTAIESAKRASKQMLYNVMFKDLSKEHVNYLRDRRNQYEISKAFDGKHTDSPLAKEVAAKLEPYLDFRSKEMVLNDAMSIMQSNEYRTFRGIHKAEKLLKKGFETWKESIKKAIHMERTFRDTKAMKINGKVDEAKADKILEKIYKNITEDSKASKTGKRKLVGKMFFNFKDMTSQLRYNEEFGEGGLFETLQRDMHTSSNLIGISKEFGSDPYGTLKELLNVQAKENPQSKAQNFLAEQQMDMLMQVNQSSVMPKLSNFLANIRAWTGAARATLLVFRSASDVGYAASFANQLLGPGFEPYLKHLGTQLGGLFNAFPNEERKYLAKILGESLHVHGGYIGRFMESEGVGELTQKLTASYYDLIKMKAYDEGLTMSNFHLTAKTLANQSDLKMHEMNPYTRKYLEKVGIKSHEWDGLRKKNQMDMFTTDNVLNMTNDELKAIWNQTDKKIPLHLYRNDLYQRVHTLFTHAADNAVLYPGLFMQSLFRSAGRKGTPGRELFDFVTQYKGFGMQYIDTIAYQGVKNMDGTAAKVKFVLSMMAGMMTMAYVSESLLALSQGKSPPAPWKMKTFDAIKFMAKLAVGHEYQLMMPLDEASQGSGLLGKLFLNGPGAAAISNFISLGGAAIDAAGTIGSFEGRKNRKKLGRQLYKTAANVLPIDNMPIISPYTRQLFNQTSHLEPEQKQLWGK